VAKGECEEEMKNEDDKTFACFRCGKKLEEMQANDNFSKNTVYSLLVCKKCNIGTVVKKENGEIYN
jgi:DNA-directed RNA polymerase subunit RPC12/RpoP